ncbi:MAG: hypothetical protein ACP5U2_02680 [Bryobacteraceae bacterium]
MGKSLWPGRGLEADLGAEDVAVARDAGGAEIDAGGADVRLNEFAGLLPEVIVHQCSDGFDAGIVESQPGQQAVAPSETERDFVVGGGVLRTDAAAVGAVSAFRAIGLDDFLNETAGTMIVFVGGGYERVIFRQVLERPIDTQGAYGAAHGVGDGGGRTGGFEEVVFGEQGEANEDGDPGAGDGLFIFGHARVADIHVAVVVVHGHGIGGGNAA